MRFTKVNLIFFDDYVSKGREHCADLTWLPLFLALFMAHFLDLLPERYKLGQL
jgi:hypothetical protein